MGAFGSGKFEDSNWASEKGNFGKNERGGAVGEDGTKDRIAFCTAELEPGECAEKIDSAQDDEESGAELDSETKDVVHLE